MPPNLTRQPITISTKNIAAPNNKLYTRILLDKTNSFIRRIRWRAFHFDKQSDNSDRPEKFGFKSRATPPFNPRLSGFEQDLFTMIRRVKFRNCSNPFQDDLKNKIKEIRRSSDVHVHSDKTGNLYQMDTSTYHEFIHKSLTSTYKKTTAQTLNNINEAGLQITSQLGISDRTEPFSPCIPFFSLKDHKADFHSKPSIRLINPTKSDIGKLSKRTLDKIIPKISAASPIPLWINSSQVIEWFSNIQNKSQTSFIQFDIDSYYPSVTRAILVKAVEFAKTITYIDDSATNIIFRARESLISFDDSYWLKKDSTTPFDVTMGANDSAQVTDLVGLFLLHKLRVRFPYLQGGLYRDDGLIAVSNGTPKSCDRLRKDLHLFFKEHGFSVTISSSLKIVHFLDTTLNLNNGHYYPYHKPSESLNYIHTSSNHPKVVIRNLVKNISLRISNLSANESIFQNFAPRYNDALARSGYKEKIVYLPPIARHNRPRNRSRKVCWFNPPYSINVVSPIARIFYGLVRKHFPPQHRYYRIFNKNTIKLSYSTTPNLAQNISTSNVRKISAPGPQPLHNSCNCINPNSCPLESNCLESNIVYKCDVTTPSDSKAYIGITSTPFKLRYNNHKHTFRYQSKRKATSLSDYVWTLKDSSTPYHLRWSIVARAQPYRGNLKECGLCTEEALTILFANYPVLNRRSELVVSCMHRRLKSFRHFHPTRPPDDPTAAHNTRASST